MKKAYRMFKRQNRPNYYIQNNSTREQHCLGTSDREEAQRLLDAANQARQAPALNRASGIALNSAPRGESRSAGRSGERHEAVVPRQGARAEVGERRRLERPVHQNCPLNPEGRRLKDES